MAIATGSQLVYAPFDIPPAVEAGASTLEVVTNGIPSVGVAVTLE